MFVFTIQVDFWLSCKCYSDKSHFPSYFRTIPSDAHQSSVLAQLAIRFGWTYVGTVQGMDEYGQFGVVQFVEEVQEAGMCIAFFQSLNINEEGKLSDYVGKEM